MTVETDEQFSNGIYSAYDVHAKPPGQLGPTSLDLDWLWSAFMT
jgi:hypothetical protein